MRNRYRTGWPSFVAGANFQSFALLRIIMSVIRCGAVTSCTCSTSPSGDTISSIEFVIVGIDANVGRGTSADSIFGGVTPASRAE